MTAWFRRACDRAFNLGLTIDELSAHLRSRREVEHLKSAHGETIVRPEMIDRIKERIVEVEPAHH